MIPVFKDVSGDTLNLQEKEAIMRQFLFTLSLIFLPLLTVEAEQPGTEFFVSDIPELIQGDLPVPLLSAIGYITCTQPVSSLIKQYCPSGFI